MEAQVASVNSFTWKPISSRARRIGRTSFWVFNLWVLIITVADHQGVARTISTLWAHSKPGTDRIHHNVETKRQGNGLYKRNGSAQRLLVDGTKRGMHYKTGPWRYRLFAQNQTPTKSSFGTRPAADLGWNARSRLFQRGFSKLGSLRKTYILTLLCIIIK